MYYISLAFSFVSLVLSITMLYTDEKILKTFGMTELLTMVGIAGFFLILGFITDKRGV